MAHADENSYEMAATLDNKTNENRSKKTSRLISDKAKNPFDHFLTTVFVKNSIFISTRCLKFNDSASVIEGTGVYLCIYNLW
jgi:hypothetical protein